MHSVSEFAVAEKVFFFEKKEAKNFCAFGHAAEREMGRVSDEQKFFGFFFKKEPLPSAAA
jgi:hypothetical protein